MPKPSSPRYRTTNWPDYNAALRRRGSLSIWFDPTMTWHAVKTGKRGHPETFSEAAIQTCLTLKVLFGLPLRQTVGLVASLIDMAGLDWPVPDYSTLCRRQARLAVRIPYRRPDGPVALLVDSTGIKFRGDGEWQARKHGASRRRARRVSPLVRETTACGARSISAWMLRPETSGPSSSRPVGKATAHSSGKRSPGSFPDPPHFQPFWRRSPRMLRSVRSRPTVPMTPDDAMSRSTSEGPKRSGIPSDRWRACPHSRSARTVAPGRRTARPPASETTS